MRLENDVIPKPKRDCFLLSADTTVTLLFFFCSAFTHPVLLFESQVSLQSHLHNKYSREEIIKHKSILRALNKEHCAIMLSVPQYELLKYRHFASSIISES